MSTIDEISNQIGEVITEQGGQATGMATIKQTLEELLAEHVERFGEGGDIPGRIEACMSQCDVISGLISSCTVEMESLQEAVGACGGE